MSATDLLRRLQQAERKPVGDLPTGYVIALTAGEHAYLVESLQHTVSNACEECGEPVCDDPSPCKHRPICDACWPAFCRECATDLEEDRCAEMCRDEVAG